MPAQAILELEDLEFSFKGSAELSAAVAAALYSERPQLLSRAENEWRIVEAFDKRYYDLEYVRPATRVCSGAVSVPCRGILRRLSLPMHGE